MALEPINTSTILKTSDPVPSARLDVPGWIVTETMEVTFGDYEGRPDVERVQLAREMLAYFFEQGWFIVAVISSGSDGRWESVVHDSGEDKTVSTERGTATSGSTEEAQSSGRNNYQSSYNIRSDGEGGGSGTSQGISNASSLGVTEAKGNSESNEEKSETKTSSASKSAVEAYWSSWQKVRLQRKRISPRKVLDSMMGELVESYNAGEKVVSERYSAVIALYSTMLARSEGELNRLSGEVDEFKARMAGVMDAVSKAMESLAPSGSKDAVDEALEYQRRTINEKFDALVASEKNRLIASGFNTSRWPVIVAGIERERGIALLAVSDKSLGWKRDMASAVASVAGPLEAAAKAMWEVGTDGIVKPTNMRNEVLKWMLDYAERHNTTRAKLEDIAQLPRILDGVAGGYAEK
jgi:hypothetical protein